MVILLPVCFIINIIKRKSEKVHPVLPFFFETKGRVILDEFFFETKGRVILELIHPLHILRRATR